MHDTTFAGGQTAFEPSRLSWWTAVLLVVLAVLPLVIWPQDVSWCIDEPRLIANAWHANNDGFLAAHGLYGNFGICYGPVPTQIYQLLLSITHDPYTIVILRALLTATVTAGSLLWLSRSVNLPAWFAAAIMISPQVANHHRVLWDASFTIPIGTLALAAFASYIKTRRPWPLRIALGAALELPLIHPQSLPLALPILGYLAWKHRTDLWKDRRGVLWTIGFLLILNFKYLLVAFGLLLYRITHGTPSYPGTGSRLDSAIAPFMGGKFLNGSDYIYSMYRPAGPDWLVDAASWLGLLVYPLIWLGIGVTLYRLPRAWRAVRAKEATPREVFVLIGAGSLVFQAIIFIAMRVPVQPQYYFGTFAIHAFFAWLGLDALRKVRLMVPVGAAFGLACLYVTFGVASQRHHNGYEANGWPTMRNAVELTQALNQYSDTVAYTDIELLKKYPQPLRTIRLLLPPNPGETQMQSGRLLVTYAEKNGQKTGRMIVQELPTDAQPPGSASMDITPLPRDWVPDPATW
jgi:hypothetical protein